MKGNHEMTLRLLNIDKGRVPLFVLAIALMLISAYSAMQWVGVVGAISGWVGLPEHEAEIPRLQTQSKVWSWLAIVLPFLAALTLSFPKRSLAPSTTYDSSGSLTYPVQPRSEKWTAPVARYLGRLAISVLGTFGFILCFLLIGVLLYKLGVHRFETLQ